MKSVAIRLDDKIEAKLVNLAHKTGRSKSFYIKKAIDDFLENQEDYYLGLAVLENVNEKKYSLTEARKLLEL